LSTPQLAICRVVAIVQEVELPKRHHVIMGAHGQIFTRAFVPGRSGCVKGPVGRREGTCSEHQIGSAVKFVAGKARLQNAIHEAGAPHVVEATKPMLRELESMLFLGSAFTLLARAH
jgi:hypothetical protein